ncbi:hypothetical protein CsSME_00002694 [Camellia sinensis var. sinensis]
MVMMMKSETLTLLLVNLAGIMERADESLLPGVYKEVGAALHTDPTGLGSLTLFRSIVQSACYPLAAYLAARHNRAHVIALGAFLWAAATFLVAISSTFFEIYWGGVLSGIGLENWENGFLLGFWELVGFNVGFWSCEDLAAIPTKTNELTSCNLSKEHGKWYVFHVL